MARTPSSALATPARWARTARSTCQVDLRTACHLTSRVVGHMPARRPAQHADVARQHHRNLGTAQVGALGVGAADPFGNGLAGLRFTAELDQKDEGLAEGRMVGVQPVLRLQFAGHRGVQELGRGLEVAGTRATRSSGTGARAGAVAPSRCCSKSARYSGNASSIASAPAWAASVGWRMSAIGSAALRGSSSVGDTPRSKARSRLEKSRATVSPA